MYSVNVGRLVLEGTMKQSIHPQVLVRIFLCRVVAPLKGVLGCLVVYQPSYRRASWRKGCLRLNILMQSLSLSANACLQPALVQITWDKECREVEVSTCPRVVPFTRTCTVQGSGLKLVCVADHW